MPLAAQLSVTFSRPMVALTSHTDAVAANIPVRITPQPRGKWRWVGTKTLLFEPDGRFPMATRYSVEVPAGTASATGTLLRASKAWSFTTPPPQVKSSYPTEGPHRRDPVMFVEFDQRVDPAAVLASIQVRSGTTRWAARLATREEIMADPTVSRLAAAAQPDRWVAFRVDTETPLPADATVNVSVGPGTPSLEGPIKTTSAQSFSFRTYGRFRVIRQECGYRGQCSPLDSWSISFTNPIDTEAFDKSMVRVEPEIPGLKTEVYGDTLVINGIKRGRTTYRVTLDAAVRDQFGQTLGQGVTLVFNVRSAPPELAVSGEPFVVLDPTGPPRFSVYSINHDRFKVRIHKVGPEHWSQFLAYLRNRDDRVQQALPGRMVVSDTVTVSARPDEMAETRIDLSPALEGGFGQVILLVEPVTASSRSRDRQPIWIQVTQIGLDAFVDGSQLLGWATSLKDGSALGRVEMTILPDSASATTEADGLARIPLKSEAEKGPALLVARKGADVAIMPESEQWWNDRSGWIRRDITDSLRWYVFDDRKMYQPGEEVHVKGWVRRIGGGQQGDVGLPSGAISSVSYVLKDSRGNDVLKGSARVNTLGGFDAAFKLPPVMNLGESYLQLEASQGGPESGREHSHQIQVQEFRRPEFEVTAAASEGPHFVGADADVTVAASYYAGGGLPAAEVNWQVISSPGHFTPPGRSDFTFGKWVPWWRPYSGSGERRVETFASRTDSSGKHRLHIDFVAAHPPRPSSVRAEATVMDVNRQAWTASATMLVHPADLYVGIRSPRTFVQKGEPLIIQSIVTDLDGRSVAGRAIKIRAALLDWVYEKGEWQQKETSVEECEVKSARDAVECRFNPKEGGVYSITATVLDDRERRNESELTLWVAGGKTIPKRDVEQEEATLIPDRKEYQPGDTAELLVQSPFYPAEGVLTLRRSGIVTTERFRMA